MNNETAPQTRAGRAPNENGATLPTADVIGLSQEKSQYFSLVIGHRQIRCGQSVFDRTTELWWDHGTGFIQQTSQLLAPFRRQLIAVSVEPGLGLRELFTGGNRIAPRGMTLR
jgi:hypothetical protein